MSRLTFLDLSRTSFSDPGAISLARAFRHLISLVHLNLSSNTIHQQGTGILAQSLEALADLQHLDLGDNPGLGDDTAMTLVPILPRLRGLTYLGLWRTSIGQEGAAALAPSLWRLTGLVNLDVRATPGWGNKAGGGT